MGSAFFVCRKESERVRAPPFRRILHPFATKLPSIDNRIDRRPQIGYTGNNTALRRLTACQRCEGIVMGNRNIKLRQHYTAYQRWRLHNTNITLISSNCTGGGILRDLNLPFTSPFINLFIKPHDFIKLCENLEHYMGSAFHDVYSEPHPEGGVYPVALLDDIPIHFMHYSSAEEAFAQWEKRKARMDWDNIYILCTDRDGCTYEDLLRFDQLKYRHKAILCNQKYPEIQSAFYIPGFENQNSVGNIINYINDHTYKKYYDLFDYVGWFNGKLDC